MFPKILASLTQERGQIEEGVMSLERLARGRGRRRERLPAGRLKKKPGEPDEGSGSTPGEGSAGVPYAYLARQPRRPPPSNWRSRK